MSALPSSLNYADAPMAIPDDVVSRQITLNPVNGGTFNAGGNIIQFDFINQGYIDPASIYLKYKYSFTNLVNAEMCGLPAVAPFSRCEVLVGSNVVESIQQYNVVATMLSNLTQDVGGKYGMQSANGYLANAGVPTLEQLDGRLMAVNEIGTFSCALPCLLSNSNKLIPSGKMPQIRLQLTTDSLSNYFTTTIATPTALVLSNIELCYTSITSPTYDAAVSGMGQTLSIKSLSYFNSSASLAAGVAGQVALVFNARLSSIKAAFIMFGGLGATSLNKQFDSYDPTSAVVGTGVGGGDISITIAGTQYPQKVLSYANNKAGMLLSLKSAVGSIYDKTNSMSINSAEFFVSGNAATTYNAPAKCIVGIPLERLHGNSSIFPSFGGGNTLMSGVSSANSAISVNLNTPTATPQAYTCSLVLAADVIMVVDTMAGQVSVRQ